MRNVPMDRDEVRPVSDRYDRPKAYAHLYAWLHSQVARIREKGDDFERASLDLIPELPAPKDATPHEMYTLFERFIMSEFEWSYHMRDENGDVISQIAHAGLNQRHNHTLSSDSGDFKWFREGQNAFEQKVIRQQILFKERTLRTNESGFHSKQPDHYYPHILLPGNEEKAFYPGFAQDVLQYLDDEGIAAHTELLNLKSSQAACLNFLFPLRLDPSLGAKALGLVLPRIASLERVDFEYTGPPTTTDWLGEPRSGKRGQNRTSIDAAFFWTDLEGRSRISLAEWKYTERGFGSCSAYAKAKSEVKARCKALDVTAAPADSCDVALPGRNRGRRYWEHLAAAGIDAARLADVEGCPFRGPFYQLMRQFLVAAHMREAGMADLVEVVALDFSENTALQAVPPALRPLCSGQDDTVIDAWNAALRDDVPPLRHALVEDLMRCYDITPGIDKRWRDYIRFRYVM